MDFTKEELNLLSVLTSKYLCNILPDRDKEAEIVLSKLTIMKSAVNISNDDVDDA